MGEKIIELIENELGVSKDSITIDTEIGGVPGWDSLHNVQIFGALEIAFNIKFQPGDIMDLETVGDIIQFIDGLKA